MKIGSLFQNLTHQQHKTQKTKTAGQTSAVASLMGSDAGDDGSQSGKTTQASQSSQKTSGVSQTDFTNMTNQQMRDWINGQIKSGQMTLDESSSLIGLTMDSPVGSNDLSSGNSDSINFLQKIQGGLDGAKSRNDAAGQQTLETAMNLLQKHQGEITKVDISA